MSNKNRSFVDEKNIFQAVLVTDNFDDQFFPITNDIPLCLLPVLNKPLLEYSLEFLALGGVEETYLFCSTHSDAIKSYINKSVEEFKEWSLRMKVNILVSESCRSFGDCLRDLDGAGLLRGDFVLLGPGVISNINLLSSLKKHLHITQQDKGAVMTIIYQESGIGQIGRSQQTDITLGLNSKQRILFHKKSGLYKEKRIHLPLEMFVENDEISILNNLRDTHISICSSAVLPLFTDNFDFQTRDDFIRGILMNEEIMGSTIYCQIAKGTQFGGAITNWKEYQTLSFLIQNRWTFPIGGPSNRNQNLPNRSIKAINANITNNSKIIKSVIGENAIIAENVTIENSFIFNDCKIEQNSIVSLSIIGSNAVVKSGAKITSCILGSNVVIESGREIQNVLIQSKKPDFCEPSDILGASAYVVRQDEDENITYQDLQLVSNFNVTDEDLSEDDDFSDSDDQLSHTQTPPPDDTKLFFTEVIDSLTRGFEDGLQCDNLILEINSSRYAYNITVKEVNFNVVKAILHMYLRQPAGPRYLQQLLSYFSPILKNYIRNESAMLDCLQAIEDVAITNETQKDNWVLFTLKWLYNQDYLAEDEILRWGKALDIKYKLTTQIQPFLKWLEEAEEASSDDE